MTCEVTYLANGRKRTANFDDEIGAHVFMQGLAQSDEAVYQSREEL